MKRTYLLLLIIASFTFNIVYSQEGNNTKGKVLESLSFKSKILNETVNYSIYLPSDYESSTLSYPAVYLLHGYSDNETGWTQFGEVHLAADRAIESREIPPMIIVMPDAKITWYINNYNGTDNYEDMFMEELIPYMEATYRIKPKREFRAVSGLSMGGYGALIYALHYPDKFAACAAFSSGVFTDEEIIALDQEQYQTWFATTSDTTKKGEDRLTKHWYNNSVLELVKKVPDQKGDKVRFYLDCGDDDFLYKGNSSLHILMFDLKISHEYRVRDGAHNWLYWRTGIVDGLKFIGESFRR
jgi:enterochelin esterase-like enzyme